MNTKLLIVDCSKTAIQQIKQVAETVGKFSIIEHLTKSDTRKECDYTIMEVQKLVEENHPSIIITRIAWPGFNGQGFRLSARIKQKFPDIIIIGINDINDAIFFWEDYERRKTCCKMDYMVRQTEEEENPHILTTFLLELKNRFQKQLM